jgi:hypothetical protein
MSRPALRPMQPPIEWVLGFFLVGVKQLRHDVDHLPPSNAEVQNEWNSTSTSHVRLRGEYRDSFKFTCTIRTGGTIIHA